MTDQIQVNIGTEYVCVKGFGKYFKTGHVYRATFYGELYFMDYTSDTTFKYSPIRFIDKIRSGHMKEDPISAFKVKCSMCQKDHLLHVTQSQMEKYLNREGTIQEIFPQLNVNDRELLISRTCGKCFDALMG